MHPEAAAEYSALDVREAVAIDNAIAKLESAGPQLPYPHSSAVKGSRKLRELRPRGGRSITRAFYRQIGDALVIGSFGPEAESDPQGFRRACRVAERRLADVEE